MKLEIRKCFYKYKWLHHFMRYVMYNSTYFYYIVEDSKKKYRDKYRELHNSKIGKRCFIIGNGPSLCAKDLDLLSNEDCFASNEIYKIFDQTNWRPEYYMIMGRYSKTSPEVLQSLQIENVFLSDYYCKHNNVLRDDYMCFHISCPLRKYPVPFSDAFDRKVYSSDTVSFGLMQLVAFMGYKEVYLIGFDHSYNLEFDEKGNVVKNENKSAHFFEQDNGDISDVIGMTKAYISFRDYASKHGITVKNCTRGGQLEVFERESLENVLNKKETI